MAPRETQLYQVAVVTADGRTSQITARSAEATLAALFDVQAYAIKVAQERAQAVATERTVE